VRPAVVAAAEDQRTGRVVMTPDRRERPTGYNDARVASGDVAPEGDDASISRHEFASNLKIISVARRRRRFKKGMELIRKVYTMPRVFKLRAQAGEAPP
jgi:hypothetical protein